MQNQKGYFRIGDAVVLGNNEAIPLTITGFEALYYGRLSGYRSQPGVYLNTRRIAVKTVDELQVPGFQDYDALSHAEPAVALARRQVARGREIRIGNLPETALYEGDEVQLGERRAYVNAIDYAPLLLGKPPSYMVGGTHFPAPITVRSRLHARHELTLIERGNAWRFHNDDTMSFVSPTNEVNFHLMMGWFTPIEEIVRNIGDARRYTVRGAADGFFFVGDDPTTETLHVVKLTQANQELKTAFRQACLAAQHDVRAFRFP